MTNIGDIGHSKRKYNDFIDHAYNLAASDVKSHFATLNKKTNRLPVIAISVDKMTIQRRTVLMTAALCLYQGKVKCFFLDSPPKRF